MTTQPIGGQIVSPRGNFVENGGTPAANRDPPPPSLPHENHNGANGFLATSPAFQTTQGATGTSDPFAATRSNPPQFSFNLPSLDIPSPPFDHGPSANKPLNGVNINQIVSSPVAQGAPGGSSPTADLLMMNNTVAAVGGNNDGNNNNIKGNANENMNKQQQQQQQQMVEGGGSGSGGGAGGAGGDLLLKGGPVAASQPQFQSLQTDGVADTERKMQAVANGVRPPPLSAPSSPLFGAPPLPLPLPLPPPHPQFNTNTTTSTPNGMLPPPPSQQHLPSAPPPNPAVTGNTAAPHMPIVMPQFGYGSHPLLPPPPPLGMGGFGGQNVGPPPPPPPPQYGAPLLPTTLQQLQQPQLYAPTPPHQQWSVMATTPEYTGGFIQQQPQQQQHHHHHQLTPPTYLGTAGSGGNAYQQQLYTTNAGAFANGYMQGPSPLMQPGSYHPVARRPPFPPLPSAHHQHQYYTTPPPQLTPPPPPLSQQVPQSAVLPPPPPPSMLPPPQQQQHQSAYQAQQQQHQQYQQPPPPPSHEQPQEQAQKQQQRTSLTPRGVQQGNAPTPRSAPPRTPHVERASEWASRARAEWEAASQQHQSLMTVIAGGGGGNDDAMAEQMNASMSRMNVMWKETLAAKKALEAAEFAETRWTTQPPPNPQGFRIRCSIIKGEMEAGNLDEKCLLYPVAEGEGGRAPMLAHQVVAEFERIMVHARDLKQSADEESMRLGIELTSRPGVGVGVGSGGGLVTHQQRQQQQQRQQENEQQQVEIVDVAPVTSPAAPVEQQRRQQEEGNVAAAAKGGGRSREEIVDRHHRHEQQQQQQTTADAAPNKDKDHNNTANNNNNNNNTITAQRAPSNTNNNPSIVQLHNQWQMSPIYNTPGEDPTLLDAFRPGMNASNVQPSTMVNLDDMMIIDTVADHLGQQSSDILPNLAMMATGGGAGGGVTSGAGPYQRHQQQQHHPNHQNEHFGGGAHPNTHNTPSPSPYLDHPYQHHSSHQHHSHQHHSSMMPRMPFTEARSKADSLLMSTISKRQNLRMCTRDIRCCRRASHQGRCKLCPDAYEAIRRFEIELEEAEMQRGGLGGLGRGSPPPEPHPHYYPHPYRHQQQQDLDGLDQEYLLPNGGGGGGGAGGNGHAHRYSHRHGHGSSGGGGGGGAMATAPLPSQRAKPSRPRGRPPLNKNKNRTPHTSSPPATAPRINLPSCLCGRQIKPTRPNPTGPVIYACHTCGFFWEAPHGSPHAHLLLKPNHDAEASQPQPRHRTQQKTLPSPAGPRPRGRPPLGGYRQQEQHGQGAGTGTGVGAGPVQHRQREENSAATLEDTEEPDSVDLSNEEDEERGGEFASGGGGGGTHGIGGDEDGSGSGRGAVQRRHRRPSSRLDTDLFDVDLSALLKSRKEQQLAGDDEFQGQEEEEEVEEEGRVGAGGEAAADLRDNAHGGGGSGLKEEGDGHDQHHQHRHQPIKGPGGADRLPKGMHGCWRSAFCVKEYGHKGACKEMAHAVVQQVQQVQQAVVVEQSKVVSEKGKKSIGSGSRKETEKEKEETNTATEVGTQKQVEPQAQAQAQVQVQEKKGSIVSAPASQQQQKNQHTSTTTATKSSVPASDTATKKSTLSKQPTTAVMLLANAAAKETEKEKQKHAAAAAAAAGGDGGGDVGMDGKRPKRRNKKEVALQDDDVSGSSKKKKGSGKGLAVPASALDASSPARAEMGQHPIPTEGQKTKNKSKRGGTHSQQQPAQQPQPVDANAGTTVVAPPPTATATDTAPAPAPALPSHTRRSRGKVSKVVLGLISESNEDVWAHAVSWDEAVAYESGMCSHQAWCIKFGGHTGRCMVRPPLSKPPLLTRRTAAVSEDEPVSSASEDEEGGDGPSSSGPQLGQHRSAGAAPVAVDKEKGGAVAVGAEGDGDTNEEERKTREVEALDEARLLARGQHPLPPELRCRNSAQCLNRKGHRGRCRLKPHRPQSMGVKRRRSSGGSGSGEVAAAAAAAAAAAPEGEGEGLQQHPPPGKNAAYTYLEGDEKVEEEGEEEEEEEGGEEGDEEYVMEEEQRKAKKVGAKGKSVAVGKREGGGNGSGSGSGNKKGGALLTCTRNRWCLKPRFHVGRCKQPDSRSKESKSKKRKWNDMEMDTPKEKRKRMTEFNDTEDEDEDEHMVDDDNDDNDYEVEMEETPSPARVLSGKKTQQSTRRNALAVAETAKVSSVSAAVAGKKGQAPPMDVAPVPSNLPSIRTGTNGHPPPKEKLPQPNPLPTPTPTPELIRLYRKPIPTAANVAQYQERCRKGPVAGAGANDVAALAHASPSLTALHRMDVLPSATAQVAMRGEWSVDDADPKPPALPTDGERAVQPSPPAPLVRAEFVACHADHMQSRGLCARTCSISEYLGLRNALKRQIDIVQSSYPSSTMNGTTANGSTASGTDSGWGVTGKIGHPTGDDPSLAKTTTTTTPAGKEMKWREIVARSSTVLVKRDKSPIHGYGLFARHHIPKNAFITELVGEYITSSQAQHRLSTIYQTTPTPNLCDGYQRYNDDDEARRMHASTPPGDAYMYRLERGWVVDGTVVGSLARFINHACQPNARVGVVSDVRGRKHVCFFAVKEIGVGEEVTVDYGCEVGGVEGCGCDACRRAG